jgi:hypothetical protein
VVISRCDVAFRPGLGARLRRRLPVLFAVALLMAVVPATNGCGGHPSPPNPDRPTGPEPKRPAQPVGVTFDTPTGFVESTTYRIVVPLHALAASQWRIPQGPAGPDVIAVTSYVATDDSTGAGDDELVARVTGYARKVAATAASTPERTAVAGYPALRQSIEQPRPDGGSFTYDAVYVFAGWYVVQVMCQYATARDQILTGCRTVLDTLRIGVL